MSEEVVGSDPVDELVVQRPAHPIWDRLVPPGHRFIALWLAGGAAVASVLRSVTSRLFSTVLEPRDESLYLGSKRWWILLRPQVFLPLAVLVVALLVWLALSYGRAPRVLALYLVLTPAAAAAVAIIRALAASPIQMHYVRLIGESPAGQSGAMPEVWQALAFNSVVVFGTLIGAWLASAMRDRATGARIGLDEFLLGADYDEDAASEQEVATSEAETPPADRPGQSRITVGAALGWEGWSLTGAGGMALGAVAVQLAVGLLIIVPGLASLAYQYAALAKSFLSDTEGSGSFGSPLPGYAVVAFTFLVTVGCYWWAIRRAGFSPAVWLVTLGASTGALVSAIRFLPSQLSTMQGGRAEALLLVLGVLVSLVTVLAPLFGAWIATGRGYAPADSATLPAEGHAL